MSTNSPSVRLDEIETEAVAADAPALDEMTIADLVALMNTRDNTIAGAVATALPTISDVITATAARMQRGGRLIYVGAGTSGRLGVLDASEIPPTFGTDADTVVGLIAGGPGALVSSVESAEDDEDAGAVDIGRVLPTADDVVIGIASSGRTPYVIGALKRARTVGALAVGLSCNLNTPVSDHADYGIEIPVGPEIVTGSTRLGAGTATKMVLNMISTISMVKLGKTYRSLMVDVKASNEKLVHRAVRIVTLATGTDIVTARRALDASDWNAKQAIAMIATGASVDEARARLSAADGFLSKVIDE